MIINHNVRMEPKDRLKLAREKAGFANPTDAAKAHRELNKNTLISNENGNRDISRKAAEKYALVFGVDAGWILYGEGKGPDGVQLDVAPDTEAPITTKTKPNASFPPRYQAFPQDHSIPLLGQSAGGPNGRFVLNGTEIGRVFCPPMLEGVEGAYAVMVFGTSMEPRYFAGETVWVNPHLPVRAGDDVIAQLIEDGEDTPVESYIKRFDSRSSRVLRLYQYNPDEGEERELEFDADRVFSVHKIVFKANA